MHQYGLKKKKKTVLHDLDCLRDFQFVQNGFDFLKSRPFVWIGIPADVDDTLEVVVDEGWNQRPGILFHHLQPPQTPHTHSR